MSCLFDLRKQSSKLHDVFVEVNIDIPAIQRVTIVEFP